MRRLNAQGLPSQLQLEAGALLIGSLTFFLLIKSQVLDRLAIEGGVFFLLTASLIFIWQWFDLVLSLKLHSRIGEKKILKSFGWANWLSLIRMTAISILAGWLFLPASAEGYINWFPPVVYLIAIVTDLLDGYAARKSNTVTRLGQKLDQDLDGRGILIVGLLALQQGRVGWWYLSIGLARYLFILGSRWREDHGKEIFELTPNMSRRALAGTLMVFSLAMLIPIFEPPQTIFVSTLFVLPFLTNFLVDWWQVSGQGSRVRTWDHFAGRYMLPLQPGLMLAFRLGAAALVLIRIFSNPAGWPFSVIEVLFILSLTFGYFGRTAAALLLIETGIRQSYVLLTNIDLGIFFLATEILFFGTGLFSLHSPEGELVQKRAGERSGSAP